MGLIQIEMLGTREFFVVFFEIKNFFVKRFFEHCDEVVAGCYYPEYMRKRQRIH